MPFFDPRQARFYDLGEVRAEEKRIFDICHGCRLCFNLCPSFPALFDALDAQPGDGDAAQLSEDQIERIEDLCFQCKLCDEKCPYTPPHAFDLDFPRVMLRARAARARRDGVSLEDRVLGNPDLVGRIGSLTAPLSNWANRNGFHRALLEKVVGIDRRRRLPMFERTSFSRWFGSRPEASPAPEQGKAAIFSTCLVEHQGTAVGKSLVRVLEKNAIAVSLPAQRCCGMPAMDGGDMATAMRWADENLASLSGAIAAGADVVVPSPTCSYVLKRDYPDLCSDKARARALSGRVFDTSEYLMRLESQGKLDKGFNWSPGEVAYQLPCHLKVQNIGFKSRDLLKLIPGARVTLIERCSGMDGTWGMKQRFYDLSLKVAAPLFAEVRSLPAATVVSDCALAALQIEQGTGRTPLHPIQVLDRAYHGGRAAHQE
jgi:Fe-S oxidoreductase